MNDLLVRIAEATNLREGSEGVRTFLQTVFQNEGISTKACARDIRLPIPIAAALKKELIKEGILQNRNGMWLTDSGQEFCEDSLGMTEDSGAICQCCQGKRYVVPGEYTQLLNRVETYLKNRPTVDVTIDQSMCTATTSLRRVLLAQEYGALSGRSIAFVGDDDLISVSTALFLKELGRSTKLTVFDIDERFLQYIKEIADLEEVEIETVLHDFRQPIPSDFRNKYSSFFTDPPYTTAGGVLFVSRGLELLQGITGLNAFISYGHKSPDDTASLQKELLAMGLAMTEVIPGFNEYIGAEMIGNHSQMMVATTTTSTGPKVSGSYHDSIYTGDERPSTRIYRCKNCGQEYYVGARENIKTIEELKEIGCQKCHNSIFDLKGRR